MRSESWLTFLVALIVVGAIVGAKDASGSSTQPSTQVVQTTTVSGR